MTVSEGIDRRSVNREFREILDRILILEQKIISFETNFKEHCIRQHEIVNATLSSSDKALRKAETDSIRRTDLMVEFRDEVKDQMSTFLTRNEFEDKYEKLVDKLNTLMSRVELQEGTGRGLKLGWAILIGAFGIMSVLINIFFHHASK